MDSAGNMLMPMNIDSAIRDGLSVTEFFADLTSDISAKLSLQLVKHIHTHYRMQPNILIDMALFLSGWVALRALLQRAADILNRVRAHSGSCCQDQCICGRNISGRVLMPIAFNRPALTHIDISDRVHPHWTRRMAPVFRRRSDYYCTHRKRLSKYPSTYAILSYLYYR
jgi:hypothetical protein